MYKKILKISKIKKGRYDVEKIGKISSSISIFLNLFLFILKLIVGSLTSSISVVTDGINNLTDTFSSLFTKISFKISSKPQDENHPFGHGRFEYIASLLISILIMFVGFNFLKTSIERMLNPKLINLNSIQIFFLLLSVFIKLWLYNLNKKLYKKTSSSLLKVISVDSLTDSFITSFVIVSLIFSKYTTLSLDAIVGIIISFVILYQAISLIKEMTSELIGKTPKKELVENVILDIKKHKEILGVHNFNFHIYGNFKKILTIDVEVDENMTVFNAHSIMSKIEQEIFEKYQIILITHIEPLRVNLTLDEERLKEKLKNFKEKKDFIKSIHDFEINKEEKFVVLEIILNAKKLSKNFKENVLKKEIEKIIKEYDKKLKISITILYEYI